MTTGFTVDMPGEAGFKMLANSLRKKWSSAHGPNRLSTMWARRAEQGIIGAQIGGVRAD